MIQFTSGTTGDSKGVVYPHHFLYLYSAMVSDAQGHTSQDVLSTPLPLFHVAALHIVSNSALHAGCRAHVKPRFSASAYWQEIARDGATFSILLGPLAAILLKRGGEAPPRRLRKLFCVPFPSGGEEFERRFRTKLLWQGPAGEVGELVYRPRLPDAMARGYYEDPGATMAAFRNLMFHTGELGEHEVKLDVVSCSRGFDLQEYHAWLRDELPRHMVPRYLELLPELPKSASTKVQKHKLAAAGIDRREVLAFEPARAR